MSSRVNERAEYRSIRSRDKEWWKPLSRLPERMRVEGRRLMRLIRTRYNEGQAVDETEPRP